VGEWEIWTLLVWVRVGVQIEAPSASEC